MRVETTHLLGFAQQLGINVDGADSVLSNDDEWTVRREWEQQGRVLATPGVVHRFSGRPMPPRPVPVSRQHGQRRSRKPAELSDFAKLFLERDESFVNSFCNPPPIHVRVEQAEARGQEWAREMFTAAEAREWVELNGDVSPKIAAKLRGVGVSPREASVRIRTARGFVERLPLVTRVSCGELTAEEAAVELRAMLDRQSTSE